MATRVLLHPLVNRLPFFAFGAILLSGALLAFVSLRHVAVDITRVYPTGVSPDSYFVLQHAGLLYGLGPFVLLLGMFLFLAPGLLLTLAVNRRGGLYDWLLQGFAASFLLFTGNAALHKWLTGFHLETSHLSWMLSVLIAGTYLITVVRHWRSRRFLALLQHEWDWRRIGWVLLLPWLAMILLLPLVFWQDFNGDGVEAFLLGQRLHTSLSPGPISLANGMIAPSVLVNWFVTLFEAPEPSTRFPVFLLLPLIFAGIVALSELHTGSRLILAQEGIIALGIVGILIAIGLNASYEPYSSDLASPGNHEFLFVLASVAMLYFFWKRSHFWFAVYALIGLFTRPTALLILVLLALAVWLFYRRDRCRLALRVAAVLTLCLLLALLWQLTQGRGPAAGNDLALFSIVQRMRHISWSHWQNFLYLAIPGGLVPLLTFGLLGRHDRISRSLILITLGFFAVFHLKAFVNLHHFAPAMALPLAVMGRLMAAGRLLKGMSLAVAYGIMLPVVFASLPQSFEVYRATREVGRRIVCDLEQCASTDSRMDRPIPVLGALFPQRWDVRDPSWERVLSPLALAFYMCGPSESCVGTNYRLQPLQLPVPQGFKVIGKNAQSVALVRDRNIWANDRYGAFRTDFRSPLYDAPPETMFQFLGVPAKEYDLDLVEFIFRGVNLLRQ